MHKFNINIIESDNQKNPKLTKIKENKSELLNHNTVLITNKRSKLSNLNSESVLS